MADKITDDLLDKAVKAIIRENLVKGYVSCRASRIKSQEMADLIMHSVDEALHVMNRVTGTLPDPAEEFSAFFAALQVMHGVLEGMIEQATTIADTLGWNRTEQDLVQGGSVQ